MHAQAKADAARQEAETVTAENSQLGAHLQLLETELDSARHLHATDSAENSPRQSQMLPETVSHGQTQQNLDLPDVSANIQSTVSGIPAQSLTTYVPLMPELFRPLLLHASHAADHAR